LAIAEAQAQSAERSQVADHKRLHLGIAAFLSGAILEDALRRLCDSHALAYDPSRTSIAKLQSLLYQPSQQVEIISPTENKYIIAWGDTRNKADHARFDEITQTEVVSMILGTRAFIEKHLG
jgi:hypothetical protein